MRVGLWERFCAYVIDGLILAGVHMIIAFIFGLPDAKANAALFGNIVLIYFIVFEASPWQATPGKRLVGFHVAARDGGPLPWWRVILRNVLRVVSILPLCAGYLTVWLLPRKQALHDLLTGSVHFLGAPQRSKALSVTPATV